MAAGEVNGESTCRASLARSFSYTIDNIINSGSNDEPSPPQPPSPSPAHPHPPAPPLAPPAVSPPASPGTAPHNGSSEPAVVTRHKAKQKSLYSGGGGGGGGYGRRASGMADEILREAAGSSLTMGIIGCLPDNVQQAIKSFSIRPGKQHITFCFPFMSEVLRKYRPDSYLSDLTLSPQHSLTPALVFDLSTEIVSGFQSFVTLAPLPERPTLPIAVFTLYQRDSVEGVLRHFEALIKVLLDTKTLLSVWKMPLLVVELPPQVMEAAIETCAQTILEIQSENLLNTFPEKSKDELLQFLKDKMVAPNIRTYQDHLQTHIKEVASKLRSVEPERFLAILDHIRSIGCTAVDYQKADMMMKSPATDPLIKTFWRLWGQEQVACKVFPIAMASRTVNKIGPLFYNMNPSSHILEPSLTSLTHVPIKEGLQSIIKGLKAQDTNTSPPSPDRGEKLKGCSCSVCKSASGPKCNDYRSRSPYWIPQTSPCSDHILRAQSAFYRPTPSMKFRLHGTSTPYSDALKAAAVLPHRHILCSNSGTDPLIHDPLSTLRNDFRRTYVGSSPILPPYWLPSLPPLPPPHPPPPPPPPTSYKSPSLSPLPPSNTTRSFMYPIVYKPKIITQQIPRADEEIDVTQ